MSNFDSSASIETIEAELSAFDVLAHQNVTGEGAVEIHYLKEVKGVSVVSAHLYCARKFTCHVCIESVR